MKSILSLLLLFLITSFTIQENNVEGLMIKFNKISEDYLIFGGPEENNFSTENGAHYSSSIYANDGMKFVKLKLTLKNEGGKVCNFNFADVYISTEKDSLYRFYKLQGYFINSKTIIKPHKELKRVIFFEFPDKAKPTELFIENKRFKIIKEQ